MPLPKPVSTSTIPKTRSSRTKRKRSALCRLTATFPEEKCSPPSPVRVLTSSDLEVYPNPMMSSKKEAVEAEEEEIVVVTEAAAEVALNKLALSSSNAKVEERAVALLTTRMSSPAFERAVGLCCP